MAYKRTSSSDDSGAWLGVMLLAGLGYGAVQFAQQHPILFAASCVALLTVVVWAIRVLLRRRRAAHARRAELDRHIAAADASSPAEFEHLVARLLRRDGYRDVRVVGGSGDLGADVVAVSPQGRRLVVQCKRYTRRAVSSPEVQRFLGTCFSEHGADDAWIVTTSWLSRPARELALRRGLRVVDRDVLAAWMTGVGSGQSRAA